MFNSGILDVAIGLVFIFLLLSLICSAVNEMIEAFLKMRAANLQQGIREFLYDKDGNGLAKDIYNHPLIFGLFKGDYNPKTSSNLPSYIPSRNFALALMDIILPAGKTAASGAAGAMVSSVAAPPGSPDSEATPSLLQPLRDKIADFPIDGVKKALLPLVDAAGNDVNQARENIEAWFDSAMERIRALRSAATAGKQ